MGGYTISALSVQQPHANNIALGPKRIETRVWSAKDRGDLLIVSSKTGQKDYEKVEPRGCAVAVVTVVDCVPMTKAHEKAAMCPCYSGAFAWMLDMVWPLSRVFAVKGALSIFKVEVSDWLEAEMARREAFFERAAILEFESGLSRALAMESAGESLGYGVPELGVHVSPSREDAKGAPVAAPVSAPVAPQFHGKTFDADLDQARLTTQLDRVLAALSDGEWWTLKGLEVKTGAPGASASARIRGLTSQGHDIKSVRLSDGKWRYRLKVPVVAGRQGELFG